MDFQPNLDAWRSQFNSDAYCDLPSILRQLYLLAYNSFVFVVSPLVSLQPMEPQICKIYLAFTNSVVISVVSTTFCVAVGSMAAYALARVQYKPKFGNILVFVALIIVVILATTYAGIPWWASSVVALALFFFLARALGQAFQALSWKRRHPFLDNFAADFSANRGRDSDLCDVSGRGDA